jgi:hypothetical protein
MSTQNPEKDFRTVDGKLVFSGGCEGMRLGNFLKKVSQTLQKLSNRNGLM